MRRCKHFGIRRILAFGMVLLLLCGSVLPGYAADTGKELHITCAEDLCAFAKACTFDAYSNGLTVYLDADIDISDTDFAEVPTFGGKFYGQGYTISGYMRNDHGTGIGFFGELRAGAVVKELNIEGLLLPGGSKNEVGGIVGVNHGTILSCRFFGTVSGGSAVGGIAGINEADGRISMCSVGGCIVGEHSTGGVAGKNYGVILRSENDARVNTILSEKTFHIDELELQMMTSFSMDETAAITDTGGIAGYSQGIVQGCTNRGTVGYPHVGYNTGGIVGRQSGYISGCTNEGIIYGRKDIGGIVGQMEPYSVWDISETGMDQLRAALDTLEALINDTANHINDASYAVSAQLSSAKNSLNDAQKALDVIADDAEDFVNSNVAVVNDVTARVSETVDGLSVAAVSMTDASAALADAIDQYTTAMHGLESSVGTLDDAFSVMEPGLDDLKAAMQTFSAASDSFHHALSEVLAGLGDAEAEKRAADDIQTACGAFTNAFVVLSQAADRLVSETEILRDTVLWNQAIEEIQMGASLLSIAAGNMNQAVQQVMYALIAWNHDFNPAAVQTMLRSAAAALSSMANASSQFSEGMQHLVNGMKQAIPQIPQTPENQVLWNQITDDLSAIYALFEAYKNDTNPDKQFDYAAFSQYLSEIGTALSALAGQIDFSGIQTGYDEICQGVAALQNAAASLEAASAALQDVMAAIGNVVPDPQKAQADMDAVASAVIVLADRLQDCSEAVQYILHGLRLLTDAVDMEEAADTVKVQLLAMTSSLVDMADALDRMQEAAQALAECVDIEQLQTGLQGIGAVADEIGNAFAALADGVTALQDAVPYIREAGSQAEDAAAAAAQATAQTKTAADALTNSLAAVRDTVGTLSGQPVISFQPLGQSARKSRENLSDALFSLQTAVGGMDAAAVHAADRLTEDIQKINAQLNEVFHLLLDMVEDAASISTNLHDYEEDISEETAESLTTGKVYNSVNRGEISGDLNIGGIAGAMSVEYDFDLEDDMHLTENITKGAKYLTRAVIMNCKNYNGVTAKKNNAGGIVGQMMLGYLSACESYGDVDSTSGRYVGGIAGLSESKIHASYARCRLSGTADVGGIAGTGHSITDCISLVQIENAQENAAAIAGSADGTVKGNRYISDTLAGVGRVSYAGAADAVSYSTLCAKENLPDDFRQFHVYFYADDVLCNTVAFSYGDTIQSAQIPAPPQKDGYFAAWDRTDFFNLTGELTVHAIYKRNITLLSSNQTREDGRPVVLREGIYDDRAVLQLQSRADYQLPMLQTIPDVIVEQLQTFFGIQSGWLYDRLQAWAAHSVKAVEYWTVSVKNAVKDFGAVRYLPAEDVRVDAVYCLSGTVWDHQKTEKDGSYAVIASAGQTVTFAVATYHRAFLYGTCILVVGGFLLILILIIGVPFWIIRAGKRRRALRTRQICIASPNYDTYDDNGTKLHLFRTDTDDDLN